MTPTQFKRWGAVVSDALLLVSGDGRILAANEAIRKLGVSPDDVQGRLLVDLAYPPEKVGDLLRLSQRTSHPVPYGLTLRVNETTVPCRCDGTTVVRADDIGAARLIIRITPKKESDLPYRLVNEKLRELQTQLKRRLAVEEQLRRNHDTLFALVENSPFGIFLLDSDLRLVRLSAGAEAPFSGIEPLLNRDFGEILRIVWPEPFATEAIEQFRNTLATGESFRSPETTSERKNVDAVESYDWRIDRIVLPDGSLGVVCYFYDLTEQQRAQEELRISEDRLRAAAEAAEFGIYDVNLRSQRAYWSPEALRLLGLKDGDERLLSTEEFLTVVHPDDRKSLRKALLSSQRPDGPAVLRHEFRVVPREGGVRWILTEGRTTFGHGPDSMQPVRSNGTLIDITWRKRLEERLRKTASALVETNRRKDEFLAILAHELRNPLAPIRNGIEILRTGQSDSKVLAQVLKTLDRQTSQLTALVDDLLDVSRLTSGKLILRKEYVDLADIVENSVDSVRPLADAAEHQLIVELPDGNLELHVDPLRLTQVCTNLLNNAIKYTPSGGVIRLRVENCGDEVVVRVQDSGIGLPSDKLDTIFDMFSQLGGPKENQQGLGIGLTLTKSLVEMHGGAISAHSEGPERGSEFSFRLPRPVEPRVERQPELPSKPADSHRRVLVVDDNRAAAEMLSIVIKGLGNEVYTVHSGAEALSALSDFRPEVVLMDLGMPGMSGYETAACIRKRTNWGKIRIVALTGWGSADDKRRSQEAGFDDHLVKPVGLPTIRKVLEGLAD